MLDFIWNLASFVIALGILITVHEYGHFYIARRNKVKVERFSVGFGKTLWRKVDRHGTEFVVALIPLGGYVKMLDERVDEVSAEDKDKTFNSKSVYQRIAIIAAGPGANFLFAIFAFYLMFLIGVPSIKPIIGSVETQSIASAGQLPDNTEIVAIDGKQVRDWQDVNMALVGAIGHSSIVLETKTSDSQYVTKTTLDTQSWLFEPDKMTAMKSLGIVPFSPKVHAELAVVEPEGPASKAGLTAGDKLLMVNGVNVEGDWYAFSQQIKLYPDQSVDVKFERKGLEQVVTVTPLSVNRGGQQVGYIGVAPKSEPWPEKYRIEIAYGPIDSIFQGAKRTWELVVLSFDMIGKLITGDVSVKNLSGPISIAQGAGNSAGYGFVYFLGFLALISVNLGIINLLPLPVLDGGHLLYYIIELLTGKPVPEKIQEIGFRFGTITLLALMSIALFNDIARL